MVTAASGSYPVLVGDGMLDRVGSVVAGAVGQVRVVLLTDENVSRLFGERVLGSLEAAAVDATLIAIPPGETSKSWAMAGALLKAFAERGLERGDAVVALGGGVVGDIAGFCAATYMRGVTAIQVPTTLLAQVDSAIGGKTAVDLPQGKNLAGAFWSPRAVVADTACLATLPDTEWRSGMAEVVKAAVLDGAEAVAQIERDAQDLRDRTPDAVLRAVRMAASLKVGVVSQDERETGARESLNLGHTLGHAIEAVAGYGVVPHGVAVAEGIRFAAMLAERVVGADPAWGERQDGLLTASGLPRSGCPFDPSGLLRAMRSDKKARGGRVRMVLSLGPGRWEVRPIEDGVLEDAVRSWCSEKQDREAAG